jgi:AhpD family alkylhydroperoxidase
VARVRLIPSNELSTDVARIYEEYALNYGPFRNQAAVMAHVPIAAKHLMRMLIELKRARNINWRYIELAIVVTSKLNACHYCVCQHTDPLKVEGLSQAAIDALPEFHPELDDVDRLVVDYTVAVTKNARSVPQTMFDRLRMRFSEAEIVELTLRIGLCGFFNRFNDALQVDDELQTEIEAAE